jgi:hypothetical protein
LPGRPRRSKHFTPRRREYACADPPPDVASIPRKTEHANFAPPHCLFGHQVAGPDLGERAYRRLDDQRDLVTGIIAAEVDLAMLDD